MILTVHLNPALDKATVLPDFTPGRTFRLGNVIHLAGGKGFNFARALRNLACDTTVVGPLGGHTGRWVSDLTEAERLSCDFSWINGETRTNLTVVDPTTGQITELYEAGPELQPAEWEGLVDKVQSWLSRAHRMVICGSVPRGIPESGLYRLLILAREAGVTGILDSYGPPLKRALAAEPALVKVNGLEISDLLGRSVTTVADALVAAEEIRACCAGAAVITLGEKGAVGVNSDGTPFGWAAPKVASVSAVGSGDSLLAGIIVSLDRGKSLPEAIRFGVAVGAANTLQPGAGIFNLAQVEQLLAEVHPLAEAED